MTAYPSGSKYRVKEEGQDKEPEKIAQRSKQDPWIDARNTNGYESNVLGVRYDEDEVLDWLKRRTRCHTGE